MTFADIFNPPPPPTVQLAQNEEILPNTVNPNDPSLGDLLSTVLPIPRPQAQVPVTTTAITATLSPLPATISGTSESVIAITVTIIVVGLIGSAFLINRYRLSLIEKSKDPSLLTPSKIKFNLRPFKKPVKHDSESTIGDPNGNLLVHISKKTSDPEASTWSLLDTVRNSIGRRDYLSFGRGYSGEQQRMLGRTGGLQHDGGYGDDDDEEEELPLQRKKRIELFGIGRSSLDGHMALIPQSEKRAMGPARVERDGQRYMDASRNVLIPVLAPFLQSTTSSQEFDKFNQIQQSLLFHIGDVGCLPLTNPIRTTNGRNSKISFPKRFAMDIEAVLGESSVLQSVEFECVYPFSADENILRLGNDRNPLLSLEVGDVVVVKRFLRDGWAVGVNYGNRWGGKEGSVVAEREGLFPVFGVEEI
ncbi:UNVERIFIED_CONTAM: hypothetical protein HDU68_006317 [Siphonaria sp. JEL0065]|nr:hypothetical protein HDU68_006317 [Siphonaria sp. JEL0065]